MVNPEISGSEKYDTMNCNRNMPQRSWKFMSFDSKIDYYLPNSHAKCEHSCCLNWGRGWKCITAKISHDLEILKQNFFEVLEITFPPASLAIRERTANEPRKLVLKKTKNNDSRIKTRIGKANLPRSSTQGKLTDRSMPRCSEKHVEENGEERNVKAIHGVDAV